jgi:outer membrane beta-barrel protein
MKIHFSLSLLVLVLTAGPVFSAEDLEQKLEGLSLPNNQAPARKYDENLYSVQSRFVPLNLASELKLAGAMNFTADSYVDSRELSLAYRFHINDRWHLTGSGSYVFNSLSTAGKKLRDLERIIPDAAWVKYRAELLGGFNLFYGKFRLNMDRVFYLDQYVAMGPGLITTNKANAMAGVGDIGLVFWMGRRLSVQVGVKEYFYKQKRELSSSFVNDVVGHFDVGFLFGGRT